MRDAHEDDAVTLVVAPARYKTAIRAWCSTLEASLVSITIDTPITT